MECESMAVSSILSPQVTGALLACKQLCISTQLVFFKGVSLPLQKEILQFGALVNSIVE